METINVQELKYSNSPITYTNITDIYRFNLIVNTKYILIQIVRIKKLSNNALASIIINIILG